MSATDFNDNHRIRTFTSSTTTEAIDSRNLAEAFDHWFKSRNKQRFLGTDYPVYIVAAQGGGIYAAYHAAMFLAAVQDKYPEFAQHIFAISAVSGGSLGAAVFVSLVNYEEAVKADRWYWIHSQKLLKQDFLSELLGTALFLDLPAQLLPCRDWFCPGYRLSRAGALERSIEAAWSRVFPSGKNPFLISVRDLWDPEHGAPALLLNTTEVETGERIVIAPWSLQNIRTPGLFSLSDRAYNLEVPLSTAVSLSARFPFITPAGWYYAKTGEKRRLVDGGYSDNSGVATALDLTTRLKGGPGYKLIVIGLVSEADNVAELAKSFFRRVGHASTNFGQYTFGEGAHHGRSSPNISWRSDA